MILNQDIAFAWVCDWVRKKYGVWFSRFDYQRSRHVLLRSAREGVPSFYVVYKREWFLTFEKQFASFVNENPLMGGLGESLNKEAVLLAVRLKVSYLAFVHPDRSLWVIEPMVFLRFAHKYNLKRMQERTNYYKLRDGSNRLEKVNELTLSVPKSLLTQLA